MILGIDLGTTNSLVSYFSEGKAILIPNSLGDYLTPSVVSINDKNEILTGLAARERLSTHTENTVSIFKRYMGTKKEFQLGKRFYRPEEISSFILKSLKEDAEVFLKQSISKAVITVPAYFNDTQRKSTKIAGELAGLEVVSLLNEPTAAALAYGLHNSTEESKFLIFDLGGGTFDVSVLDYFEGVMEVRSSTGDNFLGGEDFRNILVDQFIQKVAKPNLLPINDSNLLEMIRFQAELVKRSLSQENISEMKINWKDKTFSLSISNDEFMTWSEPLLQRLRRPVERALRDARIKSSELDQIVLAGGATKMPIVRKMVAKMFGIMPASNLNPDEIVALGAAVQAGLKMNNTHLKEMVLTDVCPYTLGIEVSERYGKDYKEGFYLPIIERNTILPVSRSEPVVCLHDNQRKMQISIYQGESSKVKDNVYLGQITVNFPNLPAQENKADVRFTYDINGILEVEVTVIPTGEKYRSIIEENPGVLTEKEIEERLKILSKLKIHPRDQDENKVLISRGERIYQESLKDTRMYIGNELKIFSAILETQDLEKIIQAREKFKSVLEELEGEIFL